MQTHSNVETTNSGISIIVDKTSQMGRFAWVTFLENVHVPVIFRNNVEYVSLLALRCQLPANHGQINKAIEKAQVTEMTKHEVRLYNELNDCHCDGLLCELHKFTKKDLLVRLDEFEEVFPLRRPKPLEIETEQPSESAVQPISKPLWSSSQKVVDGRLFCTQSSERVFSSFKCLKLTESPGSETKREKDDLELSRRSVQIARRRRRTATRLTTRKKHSNLYAIERILEVAMLNGQKWCRVRWEGYPPEYDTWEPEANLNRCAKDEADMIEPTQPRL